MNNLPKNIKTIMLPTINEEEIKKTLSRQSTFAPQAHPEEMQPTMRRARSSENMLENP
jgi:hypothetical protein